MDQEIMEQFQTLIDMMGKMATKEDVKALATKEDLREAETRINTKIENDITRRLDALTDGYKLNHEKQYELERELEDLKRRVERLENAG